MQVISSQSIIKWVTITATKGHLPVQENGKTRSTKPCPNYSANSSECSYLHQQARDVEIFLPLPRCSYKHIVSLFLCTAPFQRRIQWITMSC